ncbi:hypothetical protein BDB01DRAFT_773444 [Pilobolus umbonatus]|nr:hypothetical protein BDB01DRAFT_773444 [Pilobolus umbonatus]
MSSANKSDYNRLSFHYFNQESDVGIENEDGECVRKRKKPGRKPNPPSKEERREQNRVAQKAFREREHMRMLEKEKERRMYSDEIQFLRKKLAQTEYELEYLRGCLLQLSLSCLVKQGCIPYIWKESRCMPKDTYSDSGYGDIEEVEEIDKTPPILDCMLDNNHIKDFDGSLDTIIEHESFSVFKKRFGKDDHVSFETFLSYVINQPVPINQESQDIQRTFPKSRAHTTPHDRSIGFQKNDEVILVPSSAESYDGSKRENKESQTLTVKKKPVVSVTVDRPTLKTTDDFANMPPLQALHLLRLQMKLGSILGQLTGGALLPTSLQRVIPHDIRIDYVPGASIRDRMIIFRDHYDVDELFQSLTQTTVFTGGDVRDHRNWKVDPKYSNKFWFISHQLVEQAFDDCFNDDIMNHCLSMSNDKANEDIRNKYRSASAQT